MRVLFDTNVFIDIITKRGEFYEDSNNALCLARLRKMKIMISTVSVADLMYITRKSFSDSPIRAITPEDFLEMFK